MFIEKLHFKDVAKALEMAVCEIEFPGVGDEQLHLILRGLGALLAADPNAETYPEAWRCHADICQEQDRRRLAGGDKNT